MAGVEFITNSMYEAWYINGTYIEDFYPPYLCSRLSMASNFVNGTYTRQKWGISNKRQKTLNKLEQ